MRNRAAAAPAGTFATERLAPFERSKFEMRGFVEDWKNRKAESLTRSEAALFMREVFDNIDPEARSWFEEERTLTANGKVFVYCIVLHTKAQKIWDARAKVFELFAREELFIRGKALVQHRLPSVAAAFKEEVRPGPHGIRLRRAGPLSGDV